MAERKNRRGSGQKPAIKVPLGRQAAAKKQGQGKNRSTSMKGAVSRKQLVKAVDKATKGSVTRRIVKAAKNPRKISGRSTKNRKS